MRTSTRSIVRGVAGAAGVLALGFAAPVFAFHDGGVAHCDGCHTMHGIGETNYENPQLPGANPNSLLLIGSDPSSTCLSCHATPGRSFNVMSPDASSFTPGGDFFWLTANYTNPDRGGNPVPNDPDNAGHNVIALDFGLTQDGTNVTAPGGTYSAALLGCHSCHDPHGQVNGGTPNGQLPVSISGSYGGVPDPGTIAGNYRLLSEDLATAPIATTAGFGTSDTSHPAYGANMSEWCAGCHTSFSGSAVKHPAANDEVLNGQATTYNAYVATGDFTGNPNTSFLELVQFERQNTDRVALLPDVTSTAGPSGAANVMCLSCHRAHASAFNNIGRWDFEEEFLVDSTPNAQNLIDIGAVPNAQYYGRDIATDFGQFQRSLCNKCHAQD